MNNKVAGIGPFFTKSIGKMRILMSSAFSVKTKYKI